MTDNNQPTTYRDYTITRDGDKLIIGRGGVVWARATNPQVAVQLIDRFCEDQRRMTGDGADPVPRRA